VGNERVWEEWLRREMAKMGVNRDTYTPQQVAIQHLHYWPPSRNSVPSAPTHCWQCSPVLNGSICWFMLPFGLIDNHPSTLSASQLLTHYWSFVGFPLPHLWFPSIPSLWEPNYALWRFPIIPPVSHSSFFDCFTDLWIIGFLLSDHLLRINTIGSSVDQSPCHIIVPLVYR